MIDGRYYDRNGNPIDVLTWAPLFENFEYKKVAVYEDERITISTVWLGLNHRWVKDRR